MTNRRVLRQLGRSLVRSCVILSSPETADPLSLRDIPLTGEHPPRFLWHCQRSASSQIKVRQRQMHRHKSLEQGRQGEKGKKKKQVF